MHIAKHTTGYILLALIVITAVVGLLLSPPMPQDETYHHFSDTWMLLGIPNLWNVLSNIPFLVVGCLGLYQYSKQENVSVQHLLFYGGIALVSCGSAYYHWNPNNTTLVWDRLPMTLAFMALTSVIISQFVHYRAGKIALVPLLVTGVISIVYWVYSGDIRLYAAVQFVPLLSIPVVLLCFAQHRDTTKGYWMLVMCYILAKVTEHLDYQIHNALVIISGHTLKHVFAALGVYLMLRYRNHTSV
ncbi:MAG: ceramidase domain-containing protein [Candidatus Kapabacteria bacterium]|nr:ceramidase domain-containing protein [Candidatus Kapabacteria bacterium]MBX7154828.1 ceramidase [Bacteroidota bacterium]